MDDSIRDVEMGKIKHRSNTQQRETQYGRVGILIDIPEYQQKIWDNEAEEQGIHRSTLIRAYAAVGRQQLKEHHPKNVLESQKSLQRIVEQNVPNDEQSAESVGEILKNVIDDVEEEITTVLANSGQINQLEDQFYRTK